MIAPSGCAAASAAPSDAGVSGPGSGAGGGGAGSGSGPSATPRCSARRSSASTPSWPGALSATTGRPGGVISLGEVRVGEEGDRLDRTGEDERRRVAQRVRRGLGEVLQALDRGQPSAALHPRGERLAHEAAAGRGRDAPSRRHAGLRAERVAAEEQHAAGQRGRRPRDRVVVDPRPRHARRRVGEPVRVAPRAVGGHDERRDPAGRARRGGDRVGEVPGQRAGAARRPHPARHRAREALDVGLQRRALADVRRRVVAHDDDDRRTRLGGVVEVGEAVRQPRPEVQQDERGPVGQAPVGVRGARADALEQPEDRADPGALERLHQVQLGGPGFAKQMSSPAAAAVRSRASAPVNLSARRRRGW